MIGGLQYGDGLFGGISPFTGCYYTQYHHLDIKSNDKCDDEMMHTKAIIHYSLV